MIFRRGIFIFVIVFCLEFGDMVIFSCREVGKYSFYIRGYVLIFGIFSGRRGEEVLGYDTYFEVEYSII